MNGVLYWMSLKILPEPQSVSFGLSFKPSFWRTMAERITPKREPSLPATVALVDPTSLQHARDVRSHKTGLSEPVAAPRLVLMAITGIWRISSACDRHPLGFVIKAKIQFLFSKDTDHAKKSMVSIILRGRMFVSSLTDMPERKEQDIAVWGVVA